MDWGQFYNDDANDPILTPLVVGTRAARIKSKLARKHKTYSAAICFVVTINYTLGLGILGVPAAIYQSGVVLGPIILLACTVLSIVTVLWVADAVVRAQWFIHRFGDGPASTAPPCAAALALRAASKAAAKARKAEAKAAAKAEAKAVTAKAAAAAKADQLRAPLLLRDPTTLGGSDAENGDAGGGGGGGGDRLSAARR